jgi:hypothetical protein
MSDELALRDLKASGLPVIIFEDDAITTICDRCGDEINLAEANYAGPELPLWEGATLCNDCYAAERVSEPQPADPPWRLDERPSD